MERQRSSASEPSDTPWSASSPENPSPPSTSGGDPAGSEGPEGYEDDGGDETGPPAEDPDHDLIRSAQSGDERAFESLVRRHQQRAWRIARNMVPSDEDARDLVQEAFLRVFRSLDRFDFQYGFATWLHRIVTNLAIDHLRKRRLTLSTAAAGGAEEDRDLELVDSGGPAPSQRLEALETAARVRECIASLAPHFQAVLTLRELEGLPCTEIARIVGATHVTVRWRLHRGRKLFQEEWERRERARNMGTESGRSWPGEGPGGKGARGLSGTPNSGTDPS